MNKTMKKGIIGLLLIIVFAFIVFAPENVFAEESAECTAAREKFKKQGPKKYGIKNTYDKNAKTYTIEIIKTAEVNKFLTSNGINPVFTITGVYVNGNDAHSYMASSELMMKKTLKPGEKIVISENTLKRMALAYNGKITVVVKLKPDGFEDPDLKAACGEGTNFNYEVSLEYEYYGENPAEVITYDLGEDYASDYIMNIDCDNKTYSTGSFEYTFCSEKKKALASGAKIVKFGSKGGESHQMYEDVIKDGPTSFKCDFNINRENPNIWKLDSNGSIMYDENGERIPNPDYYANTSYLIGEGTFELTAGDYVYHVGDTKGTYAESAKCEVKCDEIVTVEYGQPVASHGGLCFEYKVRVTSRVDCGYGKISKPKNGYICTPSPYCVHTYDDGDTETVNQGGPSDDFDDCVKECDGGVYSDRCSNKCYKEVYGTSRLISQVSGNEINYATRVKYGDYNDVSPKECVYSHTRYGYGWETNGRTRPEGGCDSPWHTHLSVYTYPIYKSHGIPAKRDCNDECGWNAPGDSRCQNPCAVTGGDDDIPDYLIVGKNNKLLDDDDDTAISSIERDGTTQDVLNKIYNKINNNKTEGKTTCNIIYYNSGSLYRRYHKSKNADGTDANGYAKSWSELDKEANQKTYNRLKEICKAAAKCNTTQAEFTISASYIDKTDGKTVTINYPYEDKNDTIKYSKDTHVTTCSKTDALNSGKFTTILENDGCYNCTKGCDNEIDSNPKDCRRWYRTEWSFPGTWFSDKHQDLVYYSDDKSDTSYSLFDYKFCLPWNVGDVNQKWYNYYHKIAGDKLLTIKDQNTNITCPDGSKITCDTNNIYKNTTFTAEDAKNLTYNINASTRKFGFYEWDIDISCFYASYMEKETCSCKTGGRGAGGGGDDGYRIKVVDLENVFPDSEGSELSSTDKTGREPGFNWSLGATQTIKDPNYKSLPVSYTKWIQKKGYTVYSDKYLDYEIYLTKEKINEIKKQSVKYNVFEGKFNTPGKTEKKSASTYQSKLIRETLKDSSVYPDYNALKCNNIGDHTNTANYSAKCADFTGEVD